MKKTIYLLIGIAALGCSACSNLLTNENINKPLNAYDPVASKYFKTTQENLALISTYGCEFNALTWKGGRESGTGYKAYTENTYNGLTLTAFEDNFVDKDFSIDYQNYISKEDLSNPNGFLDIGFGMSGQDNFYEFDYYLVTLTDSVDENSKLVYAVLPQPETSGWWHAWTLTYVSLTDNLVPWSYARYQYNSGLKIAGTEQPCSARANIFSPGHSMYTGPYDHVGYNLGLKTKEAFPESAADAVATQCFRFNGSSAIIGSETIADLLDSNYLNSASEKLAGTEYEDLYTDKTVKNLFSSGYCKLNIKICGVHSNSISMHIKRIGNQTIGDSESIANASPYVLTNIKSNAVKGVPYVVPTPYAYDFREGDVSDLVDVSFSKDGTIIPYSKLLGTVLFNEAGNYKITFTTTLASGDVFVQEKTIKCFEEMPKTTFSLSADFNKEYLTGDRIALPSMIAKNALSLNGGNAVEGKIIVQCNGSTLKAYDSTTNNYLTLTKGGDYVIGYVYQNDFGTIENRTYTFHVVTSIGIIPNYIPLSFTSGKTNSLSDFTPVNYIDDTPVSSIYRSIVIDDETVFMAQGDRIIKGSLITNKVFNKSTASLVYKTGFSEDTMIYSRSYTIPTIIPSTESQDYLILKQNDVVNREAFEVMDTSLMEIPLSFDKDSSVSLPQKLPFAQLNFKFDVKQDANELESLKVIIEDFYDSTKTLVFELIPSDISTSLLIFNGEPFGNVSGSFFDDEKDFFWRVDSLNNRIIDSSGAVISNGRIKTWSDGSIFDGFAEGACVLKFEACGVKGKASVSLKNVCGQSFQTALFGSFKDKTPPMIELVDDYRSFYSLADRVDIIDAKAFDVLSPDVNTVLTILDPNGNTKYEGLLQDKPKYIYVDTLGDYKIKYVSTDDSGNSSEVNSVLTVRDTKAPTITINGEIPSSLALNTIFTFPKATVSDDYSTNLGYEIHIIRPDGFRLMLVDNNASYKFEQQGSYFVQYIAYDDFYNFVIQEFEIVVE